MEGAAANSVLTDREQVFARLTDAQLDAAYRLATVILGNRAEAEDATHDAAVRAWERFGELRDPARFEAWFGRILVNGCRDRLRTRHVRPIPLTDPPSRPVGDPSAEVVDADVLTRAILSLTPEHRTVIALHYLMDCAIEEIAHRTGERTGTVKSRLHYALRSLRAAYDAGEREVRR